MSQTPVRDFLEEWTKYVNKMEASLPSYKIDSGDADLSRWVLAGHKVLDPNVGFHWMVIDLLPFVDDEPVIVKLYPAKTRDLLASLVIEQVAPEYAGRFDVLLCPVVNIDQVNPNEDFGSHVAASVWLPKLISSASEPGTWPLHTAQSRVDVETTESPQEGVEVNYQVTFTVPPAQ